MHTSNTNFGGVGPFVIAFVKQSIQFRLGSAVWPLCLIHQYQIKYNMFKGMDGEQSFFFSL